MRFRTIRYILAVVPSVVVLAACEPTQTEDACGADAYRGLVGRPLAVLTLPANLDARIIGPDTVVTMEHRADRLNIAVDGSGAIEKVYCG